MALMGLRQYANHRKVTLRAVQKAIETGRISRRSDGKIDSKRADEQWEANKQVRGRTEDRGPARRSAESGDAPRTVQDRIAEIELAHKELKFKRDAKQLVPADDVRRTFSQIGKMHGSARESLPTQLAPKLIGKTDLAEIERIVRTELRACDERVAAEIESRFAGEFKDDDSEDEDEVDVDGDSRGNR